MTAVLERYEFTPSGYKIAGPPPQSFSDSERIVPSALGSVMPLWELQVSGELMKPAISVGIRVRLENGWYHAENDALAVYGSGASKEEAVAEFMEMAAIFATEYRALGPHEVVGLAVNIRENFLRAFPL